MRRILGSGLLLLALSATTLAPPSTASAPDDRRVVDAKTAFAARGADRAVARAQTALSGKGGDATMALTRLWASYSHLSPSQRQQADRLLARPTDGASDPYQNGYTTTEATPVCGINVCVHYVTTTDDAPDLTNTDGLAGPDFVDAVLAEMESVWAYEVTTRGYRAPAADDTAVNNGGDARLDVYLANITPAGLYGYCAPEGPVPGQPTGHEYRGYGFCVLDDDYIGYPGTPAESLEVTAAHEFFHMIQFNYDALEDSWIMESTATWMEERYADDVNDNRQYLPTSNMHRPATPLDTFSDNGEQYGNWIFFERLSRAFGVDIVRTIWQRLDASVDKPDDFSVDGVKNTLASHNSSFTKFFTAFAAGNLFPQKFYAEGSSYSAYRAPIATGWKFSPHARLVPTKKTALPHLTSKNYAFLPTSTLKGKWFLTVKVDGPDLVNGAGAELLVLLKSGALVTKPIKLNAFGVGQLRVPFGAGTVKLVTLTLANAATHYSNCWQLNDTGWPCMGTPDASRTYKFSALATR